MATTPHDRKPSRPDHWCHIEYHPGPPAGRWRTTCECGWISNWSATSAGLLELLPLDGRLRPVGTRTVASFVTSEHVVVLVGYNEPFGSYFAQWGPVVSADSGPWDFVGDVGADLVGECPSVDELVAAANEEDVRLGLADVPGLVESLAVLGTA